MKWSPWGCTKVTILEGVMRYCMRVIHEICRAKSN